MSGMNKISEKYKRAERRKKRSAEAKDLHTKKYRQRTVTDKKKDVKKMSHLEFVEAIREAAEGQNVEDDRYYKEPKEEETGKFETEDSDGPPW